MPQAAKAMPSGNAEVAVLKEDAWVESSLSQPGQDHETKGGGRKVWENPSVRMSGGPATAVPPEPEPSISGVSGGTGHPGGNPAPVRNPGSRKPTRFADGFEVPAGLEADLLPVFVREMQKGTAETGPGVWAGLGTEEEQAVQQAGVRFFEGLAASPVQDAEHPEYKAWWEASRIRSEEQLKALLGWGRYNGLNAEAAKEQLESLRKEQGQ